MKCVVFFLLAFSVFKAFFAQTFEDNMANLNGKFIDAMVKILVQFRDDVDKDGAALGIHTKDYTHPGGCTESSTNALDRFFNSVMDVYEPCTNQAMQNQDIQAASNCSDTAIHSLKNETKTIHDMAKTCLHSCSKKTPGCHKEIQKLDVFATKKKPK